MRPSKSDPSLGRGGRCMIPGSSGSVSNATEHAGSMTSSRNATWIGCSSIGQPRSTGMIERPATGTCTAMT